MFVAEIDEHLILRDDKLLVLGEISELVVIFGAGLDFLDYENQDSVVFLDLLHSIQIPVLREETYQSPKYRCVLSRIRKVQSYRRPQLIPLEHRLLELIHYLPLQRVLHFLMLFRILLVLLRFIDRHLLHFHLGHLDNLCILLC